MTIKRFEELDVWILAKEFTVLVYTISNNGNFKNDFGLRDQIRRASVSIISNIAEGFERNGNKEFTRFLRMAKGSAGEIRAQLYVIAELNYITKDELDKLMNMITSISKMLSKLIDYLKSMELKKSVKP
jgi:four helix bundle protein